VSSYCPRSGNSESEFAAGSGSPGFRGLLHRTIGGKLSVTVTVTGEKLVWARKFDGRSMGIRCGSAA